MSKTVTIAIALIGLALATVVVTWLGAGKIWQAILTLGWRGFSWVVLWQLGVFCLLGVSWWLLCPGAALPVVIWARLVREGGENCLPFSEIGGMVFGARALLLGGAGFAPAVASSVADVVTEAIGLVPFIRSVLMSSNTPSRGCFSSVGGWRAPLPSIFLPGAAGEATSGLHTTCWVHTWASWMPWLSKGC